METRKVGKENICRAATGGEEDMQGCPEGELNPARRVGWFLFPPRKPHVLGDKWEKESGILLPRVAFAKIMNLSTFPCPVICIQ